MTRKKNFFKEWREFRKLTQQDAVDKVGYSKGYISELERGERRYNQDHLEKLAAAYDCTEGELLLVNPFDPPVHFGKHRLSKKAQEQLEALAETLAQAEND